MKIVVTGCAGFIGSVVSLRAVERGHRVLALDDLSRGLNLADLVSESAHLDALTFKRHDCGGGFAETIPPEFEQSGPRVDAVVHLAAGTGSLDRPIEELRGLNVEMTKRVYLDAAELGARAFVFPTTSLALGVPDSPYVISKEEAFVWVKEQQSVPVLPLRFFNVSGAYKGLTERRKQEVHLIPRLAQCYQGHQTLLINGDDYETPDGTPSRDFVNVLDVADFILNMVEGRVEGKMHPAIDTYDVKQSDGAFWVGTCSLTTALQAHAIAEQYLGPIDYLLGPRRAFDVGSLDCAASASLFVRAILKRPLVPAWVSIRDELLALA